MKIAKLLVILCKQQLKINHLNNEKTKMLMKRKYDKIRTQYTRRRQITITCHAVFFPRVIQILIRKIPRQNNVGGCGR